MTAERTEQGRVAFWLDDEGWGAIESPSHPGVGFAHFSIVEGFDGYRSLAKGERVEFEWASDAMQDGCQWMVAAIRPVDRD